MKQEFPCSESKYGQGYSLNINCGCKKVSISNNTTYEANLEARGASMYYMSKNWAFSSTGNFMDNDLNVDNYIDTSVSTLYNTTSPLSMLYRTAHVYPLSLTYYGLCLLNGNYTVNLHLAEILFTDDSSFNSLGKRIFDVYLQRKMVLKDFDIAAEAGGPIVKNFTAVVTSNTLKIHLY
ncbi:hypothetical protein ACS0TY_035411 [Phlomoides rotata]